MSTAVQERAVAAPGTRCLLLQLEPTPYILPRALYVYNDPELHTDLIWTFVNSSQNWGSDADVGDFPVLLDPKVLVPTRLFRVGKLMWNILRGRYTVAHLAGWGHWVVRLSILCCKLRGVPFSLESDTPLKSDDAGWRESVKRIIYPVILNWASVLIPGGTRQSDLFRHYGISEKKIKISHMTVDTRRIISLDTLSKEQLRSKNNISGTRTLALFVGRLIHKMGIQLLLDSFAGISSSCKDLDLVIIGDGPMRGHVEDASRNMPGRVHYLGRQSQIEVVGWMRASDFFVLPSTREPWGLVANEAMTCGLPVIASDSCGCVPDLIENKGTGLVFPSGDGKALASAMAMLAQDHKTRHDLSVNARKLIEPWVIERQAETIRSALAWMSNQR